MELNYFRLAVLLTDTCQLVLRRFLEDQLLRAGYSSFIDLLNQEKHKLYHCLHPGRRNLRDACCCGSNKESYKSMTKAQWEILYVDTGNSKACTYTGTHPCKYEAKPGVKLEDMDFSRLHFMIDKIFPGTTALYDIRKLRNELIHSKTTNISDSTFWHMWFSAKSSILQIANTIAAPFPSEVQQEIKRIEGRILDTEFIDRLFAIEKHFRDTDNLLKDLLTKIYTSDIPIERLKVDKYNDIPTEIRRMDQRSQEIFISALKKGKYKSYHIRLMFVGHFGVGKTSLAMRLLEKCPFDIEITSTNGIEIFNGRCFYNRETGEWVIEETARKLASASEIIARDIFEAMNKKRTEVDQAETTDEDKSADNPLETEETSYPRKGLDKKTEEYNVEDENKASASLYGHSPRFDITLLEETINAKLKKTNEGDEFLVPVDIWDFGGQAAFYTSHQIFLTDRSIYLLAFDASRDLEDDVQDQSLDVGGKGKSSVREFLQFWISSIKTYTGQHTKGSPKIILIGTHWDFVPQEERQERKEKIKTLISEHFREELDQEQLVMKDELFFNVTDPKDNGHEALKAEIIRQAESQSYWGEELPKTWLPLRDNLFHMKQNNEKIVSKQNVKEMNEQSCTPLKNDELDVFLNFLHSLGHILYFNVADLKDHVILDPQWTIDALKSLITAELFCEEDRGKYEAWRNMSKQGILTEETITSLWSREEYQQFALHRSHLLKTMEKLDLVVKPMTYDESGKECETDYYYVPCMLKESYPEERTCFIEQLMGSGLRLDCMFEKKLLPLVVFNRLVAVCISTWPVMEDHLYFGLCLLKLDSYHTLVLQKNGHIIQITVSHTRGKSSVIKSICRWIEDFIMSMLKKITIVNKARAGQYGEDLPFTLQWQSDIQETVEDRYFECSKDCEGFSEEALELKPTDLQLYRLSTLLDPRHMSWLAIELGIRDVELNEIKEDNSSDSRFVILERWRNRASKREAKFKTLQAAFRSIGDIDQHIFCQIYKKEEKYAIDPEDLPADKGTRKPSDKLLSEAVLYVGTKYFHVAMEIGISCKKMNFIRMEHQGNLHVMTLEMLKYWRQNSTRATVKDLALAIRIAGSDYSGFCEMVNATK